MARRVLVVDDEPSIRAVLAAYLRAEGFDVTEAATGAEALRVCGLREQAPDLVLLDIGLPDIDGLEVLRRLRTTSDVYVVLVTARTEEVDKLVGLGVGADDYVTKPFSPRELVARVKAVLRRGTGTPGDGRLSVGGLTLDLQTRRATASGAAVELTTTEFDLLAHLMRRPDRVFTREELLGEVWGYPAGTATRTVDVHVAQVRTKIGAAARLRTVRGVGYAIERA